MDFYEYKFELYMCILVRFVLNYYSVCADVFL